MKTFRVIVSGCQFVLLQELPCSLAIDVLVHPFAWSSVDADAAFAISEHLPIFGDATRQL